MLCKKKILINAFRDRWGINFWTSTIFLDFSSGFLWKKLFRALGLVGQLCRFWWSEKCSEYYYHFANTVSFGSLWAHLVLILKVICITCIDLTWSNNYLFVLDDFRIGRIVLTALTRFTEVLRVTATRWLLKWYSITRITDDFACNCGHREIDLTLWWVLLSTLTGTFEGREATRCPQWNYICIVSSCECAVNVSSFSFSSLQIHCSRL